MSFILDALREGTYYKISQYKYNVLDFEPYLSDRTITEHEIRTRKYKDNQDKSDFNNAGFILHDLMWSTIHPPKSTNKPSGKILEVIEKRYKTFSEFKRQWNEAASTLEGAGWIALSKTGLIMKIKGHSLRDDIVMLLDMWEHAYIYDYGLDKDQYIADMWKMYNWEAINRKM